MARPRVAVLHHPRSFFPLDLHEAVWEHIDLVWVLAHGSDAGEDPGDRRLLRRLGTVVDVAGLDLAAAARLLAEARPEGIVTFVDDHLELAAGLAAELGLRFHAPEAAQTIADKRLQRAALARAGIPGPRFWPLHPALDRDQVEEVAAGASYPAVLKHAHGMGSRDMRRIEGAAELLAVVAGDRRNGAGPPDSLLEQHLEDDGERDTRFASYLSVESVVQDGRAVHAALTGRFPLAEPYRETGNFIPGVVRDDLRAPVLAMTEGAIEALEIRDSVVHTEIKLTPDGPALIEVNGRLGGRPPFVLRRVSDVNLFLAACLTAVGAPAGVDGEAVCDGVGYWLMLQPPMWARRVAAVEGLDGLSREPDVDVVALKRRPGDAVDWREGTDGNVVTIRGAVGDHDALAATVERLRRRVRISYDDGGGARGG